MDGLSASLIAVSVAAAIGRLLRAPKTPPAAD